MVLISTAFFALFGIGSWKILSCLWALVPLCNVLYFSIVPIGRLTEEGQGHSIGTLFKNKLFWLFFFLMLAAGASEMGMSQWSSAFAESGLKVTKSVGDLLGPCLFAILMGSSRVIYAKLSKYISLKIYLLGSCLLCIVTYLIAVFARVPVLALRAARARALRSVSCGRARSASHPPPYPWAEQQCLLSWRWPATLAVHLPRDILVSFPACSMIGSIWGSYARSCSRPSWSLVF